MAKGKGKAKAGKAAGTAKRGMDWEPVAAAAAPVQEPPSLSAKDKLRQKMANKRALRVQITELKKTRTKIGKAKDKRMDRREVTNQLKQLKAKKLDTGKPEEMEAGEGTRTSEEDEGDVVGETMQQ
mmetsp:Transcript_10486/g.26872  ORF Transcript_10486/g.26872 Transcript_10486/m.26872 type:complete len:126 (+) Transcript_10486:207-584(+)|eukprot:jgi/Tetstr1/427753/TSEL_017873.t1